MNQGNYGGNQYMYPPPRSGGGIQGHYVSPFFGHSIPHGYCPSNPEYIHTNQHRPPHHAVGHVVPHYNPDYLYPPPPPNLHRPVYGISRINPINENPNLFSSFQGVSRHPYEGPYFNQNFIPPNPPRPVPGIDRAYNAPYYNSEYIHPIPPMENRGRILEIEEPERIIDKMYHKKERNKNLQQKQVYNQQNENELISNNSYNNFNYIPPSSQFYQGENEQDTKHAKKIPLKVLNEISKSICKIIVLGAEDNESWNATGFFMNFQKEGGKVINLLITNSHVIPQEIIESKNIIAIILENGSEQIIELNNKERFIKCLKSPIDITAIEILDTDELNNNIKYLAHDLNYEEGYQHYINADVFSLQHPLGNDIECASGKIIAINSNNNFEFIHTIDTDKGSSGSPIILVGNSRVIGIHKAHVKNNKNNKGTFIGVLLKEIKNLSFKNENEKILKNVKEICSNDNNFTLNKNEYKEIYNTPSSNINPNIIIMQYNVNCGDKIKIFGDDFVKNNHDNCKIIINGINLEICKFIDKQLIEGEKLEVQLKEIKTISNMSYMFEGCESLLFLSDQSRWDTSKVINMSYMFCGCKSLLALPSNFSKNDTSKVVDMTGMFYLCSSLTSLPDISEWKTSNVKSIVGMFYGCSSLCNIPDISKWDTSNVTNMLNMFYNCSSLKALPDISKWNTSNITNMCCLFYNCSSLKSLPDISGWNVSNVTDMKLMFGNCSSLNSLPDISKWNLSKFVEVKGLIQGCDILLQNGTPEVLIKLRKKEEIKFEE